MRFLNLLTNFFFKKILSIIELCNSNRHFNLTLLTLTVFIILYNLPFLKITIYPQGETKPQFWTFLIVYNQLFFHHEIPLWFPHSVMGMPSDFELITHLSPANYMLLITGALLKVKNALMLFNISIIIEQIFFLFGLYKLSTLIYRRKSVVFFVCFIAISSVIWNYSLWWNFRLYYLVPLILYLIINGIDNRKPEYVWLAGITTIISMIGNLQYYAPLYLFIFSILGITLLLKNLPFFKLIIKPSWKNYLAFLLFFSLAAAYVYYLIHITDFMEVTAGSRDPHTGKTPLIQFLTHTRDSQLLNFDFFELISGINGYRHNTFFIGILPILLFIISLFIVDKNLYHKTFIIIAFLLIWFTIGGLFSRFMYYFPAMGMFRNITLTFSLIKIFIILCSGFALEHLIDKNFFTHLPESFILNIKKNSFNVNISIILLLIFIEIIWTHYIHQTNINHLTSNLTFFSISFSIQSILIFLLLLSIRNNIFSDKDLCNAILCTIIICVMVDLVSFQFRHSSRLIFQGRKESVFVRKIEYQPMRVNIENHTHLNDHNPKELMFPDNEYWLINNAKNIDPYKSNALTAFSPSVIIDLLKTVNNSFPNVADVTSVNSEVVNAVSKSLLIRKSFGCESQKLRIITDPIVTNSIEEARSFIKQSSNFDRIIIINKTNSKMDQSVIENNQIIDSESQDIIVRKFTANSIEVEAHVTTKKQSYLVYSDNIHPGWTARNNGKHVPIFQSNLAFKAVPLQKGLNIIQFTYSNGIQTMILIAFIVCSLLFSIFILYSMARLLTLGEDQ